MSEWTFDAVSQSWRCKHCGCKESSGYHETGCPARNAPAAPTKAYNELERLARELTTQDNAITSDPIFVVQQKHRQFGLDMDYCENFAWVDSYGERTICDDATDEEDTIKLALLEKAHDGEINSPTEEVGDKEGWTRTGYLDKWEFVQPFLTRAAAERFRADQSHNLGVTRVYVESAYRNPEWRLLREIIATLGATQ